MGRAARDPLGLRADHERHVSADRRSGPLVRGCRPRSRSSRAFDGRTPRTLRERVRASRGHRSGKVRRGESSPCSGVAIGCRTSGGLHSGEDLPGFASHEPGSDASDHVASLPFEPVRSGSPGVQESPLDFRSTKLSHFARATKFWKLHDRSKFALRLVVSAKRTELAEAKSSSSPAESPCVPSARAGRRPGRRSS